MKTSKTKIRPQNKQLPKIEKPFFGHSQGNDFFSVVRAPSTPFFQPQVVSPFALQAKSTTSKTEGISETVLQRMPAFESELIAKSELQRSPEPGHQSLQLQTKLTIGQPNDQYEQEADRVASKVVQQINDPASTQSPQRQSIQRQKTAEEELQTQPKITSLQRQEEKSEELQSKSIIQSQKAIAGGEATGSLESAIAGARGSRQPLAPRLQAQMGQVMVTGKVSGTKLLRTPYDAVVRMIDPSDREDFGTFAETMKRVNKERLMSIRGGLLERAIRNNDEDDKWAVRFMNRLLGDLAIYNGQPPYDHALSNSNPNLAAEPLYKMSLGMRKLGTVRCFPPHAHLYRHRYQVGQWQVDLFWPKNETDPGPNRFGILPKHEYGTGGGQPK